MPMYEVTLMTNVKVNHQEHKAGEQLTVDAELYAELKAHDIIKNVREIEEKKPAARKPKAVATKEDGERP